MKTLPTPIDEFFRRYMQRHNHNYGTPLAFSFLVTNRCFLRCKHCFYHQRINLTDSVELTLDEYRRLSNSLDDFLIGIFSGGEPFVRDDFAEIVTLFRKNNRVKFTDTSTNGQLTSSILRQAEEICKCDKKPFFLSFSIDGPEEVHDEIRGKGVFMTAMRTWKECKKLKKHYPNLRLAINTVFNSINQDSMETFLVWLESEIQPDEINLMLIRQNPRAGDEIKKVDYSKFEKSIEYLKTKKNEKCSVEENSNPLNQLMLTVNSLVQETTTTGRRSFYCYAGIHGAFVDYNGDVNACEVLGDQVSSHGDQRCIGNLRDHNLNFHSLWNSESANLVRNMVNKHKACTGCTHETEGLIPSIFFKPNKWASITEVK